MSAPAYVRAGRPHPGPALTLIRAAGRPGVDAETFRTVFRGHAASVAVVTADAGAGPVGFTVTSVVSVSLDPPLFSFVVATAASSASTVLTAERVAVHLLDADQADLAGRFAARGVDRFAHPTRWASTPDGLPVLDEPPVVLVGSVLHRLPAGDHHLVLARLDEVDRRRPYRPLLYRDGRYTGLLD